MRYVVSITEINYGAATVEADSKEQAEEKAKEVYYAGNVHWTDSEISDISTEFEGV